MSNLKKALFVLLFDQSDSADLEVNSSDETYIDYIVNMLIEKNDRICPFKNYDCIKSCKAYTGKCCENFLAVDCDEELDNIWRDFIGIESKEVVESDI